jgi:hypothetical protein
MKNNFAFIRTKYFPNKTALEVNSGDCFRWAYIVKKLYPNADLLSAEQYHAFIRFENKFYDAERPLGVKELVRLPSLASISYRKIMLLTTEEFVSYWKIDTNSIDV